MVAALSSPTRPLPAGGETWTWTPAQGALTWCRVYHLGTYTRSGHDPRAFGPLSRFDPHRRTASGERQVDPDGRSVLYVGLDLATSLCEVFGEVLEAQICSRWRVAVLQPLTPLQLFDLCAPGAAMSIGALPALADGDVDRALTQEWARAIYEDQPASGAVTGIRYRSAYNGDLALALWDSAGKVATATSARGADFALNDPLMLGRVRVACSTRRIAVEVVDPARCTQCRADP